RGLRARGIERDNRLEARAVTLRPLRRGEERGPCAVGEADKADSVRIDRGKGAQIGARRKGVAGPQPRRHAHSAVTDVLDAARLEAVDDERRVSPTDKPTRPGAGVGGDAVAAM